MNLIEKLSKGLSKTRERMAATFATVFGGGAEAARELELMEEYLLLADVGPVATAKILAAAAENRRTVGLLPAVRNELLRLLSFNVRDDKKVKIFAGVNGTGKTTTVGKLAHFFRQQGMNVFVIGADTFRAAADQQLEEWCRRTNTPVFAGKPGSDPASVVFDGLHSNLARTADYVLCDTAGRLHVNKNLMQELAKLVRVAGKACPDQIDVFLTLDAGTGQNALAQVDMFSQWVQPTGLVLTKLDGTAKGGIAVALAQKFSIPIRYVGLGEGPDDLVPFSPEAYVDALLPQVKNDNRRH